jgi:long-chain acyl-CoA synthetase
MTFLESVFQRLEQAGSTPVVREARNGELVSVTGHELLGLVRRARSFLVAQGLKKGDRCALLAPNSIRWVAADLAMMSEGFIVVPLYQRQSPAELAGMMKDSMPALVICSDEAPVREIRAHWPVLPRIVSLESIFSGKNDEATPPYRHADHDALTIIYTSGTSGEPKGVILNAANVNHMLQCTNQRLDQLMNGSGGTRHDPDRPFHYLPFCFAASWIALLTFLSRESILTLSTDITRLSDELKLAAPDYFLNVPTLLERVRAKIEETVRKRGGLAASIFSHAQQTFLRRHLGENRLLDSIWLFVADTVMFPAMRKSIGPNLKALICGSAPLSLETQLFFMMLGIPVLQVYGLTETTAICTMDDPHDFEPGRVGRAIPGVEMTIAESGEILVRGPNVFPGYWQRPVETSTALEGGWFHTGDQGDVDAKGNWRITGRLKNLIILNSGHNVAPEPLEQALAARLPKARQVVLLGNQRSFLSALVTVDSNNGLHRADLESAIEAMNSQLPHYKHIREFCVVAEPFTVENGLLTSNGKLKRSAIAVRFAAEIEQLYQKKPA